MEPLAPGTEDEAPALFASATKQEKEKERLLSLRTVLPNGRYGNVFDLKYINGAEHWYCNACACPVMGWVFHHEAGKRHKTALGSKVSEEQFPTIPEPEEPIVQVAPGEPVPPGFEGQVEKVALIQERLDAFSVGPLVALEYLLELRDYDATKEPTYLCVLCDKKGDPRTVLTHLASYKHILQYLQKHFPACYRALAPYMTKQYKRNWQQALHEVAEAIEKRFGRLRPMPVESDKFEKDQDTYLEMIAKGRHFSELSGFTFENLINKDELTKVHEDESDKFALQRPIPGASQGALAKKKSPSPPIVQNPIKKVKAAAAAAAAANANATATNPTSSTAVGSRRRSLSSVSTITSSDLSDFDDPKDRKPPVRKRSRSRSRSPYGRRRSRSRSPYSRRRSPPPRRDYYRRSRSRSRSRERGLMPWERSNYKRSLYVVDNRQKNKNDKIEEYKKLCKAIDNDMERVMKNHKKNPEKHPHYNDEWKKFWNKRYKELQAESKDVSTYDFKPEWIEYWNKKMIELHIEEVKTKKDALKKRLGLAEDPTPISFKIEPKRKLLSKGSPKDSKVVPTAAQPDNDTEIIVIDDRDDESKGSKRSRSPWEDEPSTRRISKDRDKSRSNERDYKSKSRDRDYKSKSRDRDYKSRSPVSYRSRSRSPRYRRSYSRSPERERRYYRPKERYRIVSELPWERDRRKYGRNEIPPYYKPPAVMRDVTREPVRTPPPVIPPAPEEDNNGEVNVVGVLRLLTALEERLGSLGPKVIDLLANALAMEKNEANSSENLLDNEVNCVLFETVKEKLKGQLLAGLVDIIQERAFKNAIKKIASLIHLAGERKKERERAKPKIMPLKVPGVGTVDKAAIARQIANALVEQGKTDVTQNELEQLIDAVVGMAEASKSSGKQITTAAFLEQINKGMKDEPTKSITAVAVAAAATATATATASTSKVDEKEVEIKEKPKSDSSNMESLSDSDLQTLLQNFKDLSTEEQHSLINYLKKLEAVEPDRVERLRKFVNLGPSKEEEKKDKGRESPFSNRTGSVNPTAEEKFDEPKTETKIFTRIDSDDEDYSFEDVVKVATKNVKARELEEERKIVEQSVKLDSKRNDDNLENTKSIISNIMSNINKPGLGAPLSHSIDLNSPDFAKTIKDLPVNLSSLANIVGSVQNLTKTTQVQPKTQSTFETPSWGQGMGYNRPVDFQANRPNVAYPINSKPYYGGFEQPGSALEPPQGFGGVGARRLPAPQQQQQQQQQQQFNQYPNRNNYRW